MPLTREQTKYQSTNDTVFLPTVAIDRNLAVRGNAVFDGSVRFNGSIITPAGLGNAGQYLESTGTGVRWTTVSGYSAPTLGTTLISSGSTVTTISNLNVLLDVDTVAKTGNYQITTADANKVLQMNGAFVFQVDTSLAVLPLGTQITLVAQTTGVSVATTANATVPTINATPGLKLRAAWSSATLIKMSAASASGSASTWLLTGDLLA